MSTAYHPETDRTTERANCTVVQMLHQCVSVTQKDWVTKLPAIWFAINFASCDSTRYSPFEVMNGCWPAPLLIDAESAFPGVWRIARQTMMAVYDAHNTVIHMQVHQMCQVNKHRQPSPFKEGDLVFVSTADFAMLKGHARKLAPKYFGPILITKEVAKGVSYCLELPEELLA